MDALEKENAETSEDEEKRELLKDYLNKYYRSYMKKKQLERTLSEIRDEIEAPLGGKGYSPTPRSTTNNTSPGAAGILYKEAEIEERILCEKEIMLKNMIKIMDIMDFLDKDSTERTILEYRHINKLGWREISKEMYRSRQSCIDYYNTGLDMLLGFKKVQVTIGEYQKEKYQRFY